MSFTIKQGDTAPSIQRTLSMDGAALDLTSASVRFHMVSKTTTVVDAPANLVDAANGVVRYDWQAADTAQAGSFRAEFEITYGDGSTQTAPNEGYIFIIITPQLA